MRGDITIATNGWLYSRSHPVEGAAATNTGVLAISVLPGLTGKTVYGKEGTVYMRSYPGGLRIVVR